MADVSLNNSRSNNNKAATNISGNGGVGGGGGGGGIDTSRKMSFPFNGKLNGIEGKTPFLIGVSGGTASGKVFVYLSICLLEQRSTCKHFGFAVNGMQTNHGETWSGRYGSYRETSCLYIAGQLL